MVAGVPPRQGIRIEPHGMHNDQRHPVTHTPGLLRVCGELQIGSATELASREAPRAPYGLVAIFLTGQRIGAVLTHLGRWLQFRGQ